MLQLDTRGNFDREYRTTMQTGDTHLGKLSSKNENQKLQFRMIH